MAMALPLLFLLLSVSLVPSHAATKTTCSSYKFSTKQTFSKCSDLPTLGASLHWTYNTDGTLSIAFVAPPASPNGWVAWGINPTTDGMLGTQALLAFKDSTGKMTVKTSNVTSYKGIEESPILYKTSGLSAESGSDGNFVLFATLTVGKSVESLNQVYQVGASVTNGVPDKHAFAQDNLNAKAELTLSGSKFSSAEPAAAPAPTDGGSTPSKPSSGEASSPESSHNAAWRNGVSGLWSTLVVLLAGYIVRF